MYKKANKEESKREVFVLQEPSPNYLAIDLSGYSEDKQEIYAQALTRIQNNFKTQIEDLGLAGQYRCFKPENMTNVE